MDPHDGGFDPARPEPPAGARRAARAVLALAAATGIALVGTPAGVGLTALLLALGVVVARAPREIATTDLRIASPPGQPRLWWALAAALACVPVLRAATWVVIPSVAAAAVLAAVAVGGNPAWLGALRTGRAAVEGVSARGAFPALRGAAIAAALLAVFVPLLVSADAAFAQLAGGIVPSAHVGVPAARAAAAALVLLAGGALLHARAATARRAPRFTLGRTEWAVPLGALTALLAAFVATQAATLFGGNRHVLETAGLTYAQYARSGFVQMAVVAALSLAVVAAASRHARDGGVLLRGLLAALCVLTLVVIASAVRRLGLYEHAYGYTRLRLTADAILLWLGALFLLVLVSAPPRALLAASGAAVLVFALSDPDRRIAEHNVAQGRVDVAYLSGLSADAVPALRSRPAVACAIRRRLGHDGLVGLNVARLRAGTPC